MSRIREALKKAAQERQAQFGDRSTPDIGDLSAEGLIKVVLPENRTAPDEQVVLPSRPAAEVQVFKDFLTQCSHPGWRINPQLSVFNPQANPSAGAERFRTLRSRLFQVAATQPLRRLLV
jgi:hypothetical protein